MTDSCNASLMRNTNWYVSFQSFTTADFAFPDIDVVRRALVLFYTRHDPSLVASVDALMNEHQKGMHAFLTGLEESTGYSVQNPQRNIQEAREEKEKMRAENHRHVAKNEKRAKRRKVQEERKKKRKDKKDKKKKGGKKSTKKTKKIKTTKKEAEPTLYKCSRGGICNAQKPGSGGVDLKACQHICVKTFSLSETERASMVEILRKDAEENNGERESVPFFGGADEL